MAILRLGSIGDVIATLPFAWMLRVLLGPGARIVWIAHPGPASILSGVRALDEVVVLPRGPLWASVPRWRRRLRAAGIDATIDLQGNSKSAVVARLTGARLRVGYSRRDRREPLNSLGTNRSLPDLSSGNKTRRVMEIAEYLGYSPPRAQEMEVRFGLEFTEAELRRAHEVVDSTGGVGSPMTLVQLGRPGDVRGWPSTHWIELLRALAGVNGPREEPAAAGGRASVVVLAGPGEAATGREIESALGRVPPGVRFELGTLTLREVGALCHILASDPGGHHIVVGADSGCLHLASACGLAAVALFGPQDPVRTAPVAGTSRILYHPEAAACVPCSSRECFHIAPQACMRAITPDEVHRAIKSLQGSAGGPGEISRIPPYGRTERIRSDRRGRPERTGLLQFWGLLALAGALLLLGALWKGGLGDAERHVVERAQQTWPLGRSAVQPGGPSDLRSGPVLVAASMALLGGSPLAARLPSVISGVVALLLTARIAWRLSVLSTGLLSAVCLLCMPGFLVAACSVGVAPAAMACALLTVAAFLDAEYRTRRARYAGMTVAGLLLALTAGVAGPAAFVILALSLLVVARYERNRVGHRSSTVPGLLCVGVGTGGLLSWISVAVLRAGMDWRNGLTCFFLGADSGVREPGSLPWLAVAGLPVTLLAPIALYAHLRTRRHREDLGIADRRWRLPKAVAVIGIVVLLVFPLGPGLAAPVLLPFLAILVGSWLERVLSTQWKAPFGILGPDRQGAVCGTERP